MAKSDQELIEASVDFAYSRTEETDKGVRRRYKFYEICKKYERLFDTTTPRNMFELFWDKVKEK